MKKIILAVAALLAVFCLVVPAALTAVQDKPQDLKKIVGEIAGDWEFSSGGETLVVQFVAKEDKLFGAPPGETLEELKPVAGKPLCFDVTLVANGQYYLLQFARNENGVIDKCMMDASGMQLEGVKIVK